MELANLTQSSTMEESDLKAVIKVAGLKPVQQLTGGLWAGSLAYQTGCTAFSTRRFLEEARKAREDAHADRKKLHHSLDGMRISVDRIAKVDLEQLKASLKRVRTEHGV